jgi:hypothetical protein
MKYIKSLLLISIFSIVSLPAFSIGTEGLVERIYPQDGKIYFRLIGDTCKSTAANKYWHFDLVDDSGKAIETAKAWFAMLLSASATKTIIKVGAASCDSSTNAPIILSIRILIDKLKWYL